MNNDESMHLTYGELCHVLATLQATIAAQEQRISELEAELAEQWQAGMRTEREHQEALARFVEQRHKEELVERAAWEPAPFQRVPGDVPMFIRDGRLYYFDWEEWNSDEWPGDWGDWDVDKWDAHKAMSAAMTQWVFGGDEDWLIMRRTGSSAGMGADGEASNE